MLSSGPHPDHFTVPIVASSCAELQHVVFGTSIHGLSVKLGLSGVGSALVYMYSKCGLVWDAVKLFDEMRERDVVAWTAIVIGCVSNGKSEMGLVRLREMCQGGVLPSYRTLEGGIQACGGLGAIMEGKCLHGFSFKIGTEGFRDIKSTILAMYSKCESLEEACRAFRELPERDIVSWTSIVGVHARKGLVKECLELFREMMDSGMEPDGVFLSCFLAGFANGNNVYGAKAFHGIILRRYLELYKLVVNSLICMYCKLELLDDAEIFLHMTSSQDLESWNLMVSEYSKRGLDAKCLDLFREIHFSCPGMGSGISSVIFAISSCSQLGALLLGQSIHCYTIKSEICGDPSVCNSLITLYGRCGRLDLARRIFDNLPRDVITWNSMLSAYAQVGHSNDALSLFDQMLFENVKPNSTTLLIALSACSHVAALHKGKWIHEHIKELRQEWKEVESLRGVMKCRGVKKRAGWSSVEMEGRIHVFVVGEKSHIQSEEVDLVLEALGRMLEE
ncbi:uncharacterized protein A4U43_C08F21350 [Asparagus officinalis]|nr:uncharacterized protein A4U43_C08F21350 [Asparagus officinalis]